MKIHKEKYKQWRIEIHCPGIGYIPFTASRLSERLIECDSRQEAKETFERIAADFPSDRFRLFEVDIIEQVIYHS